MQVHDGKLRVIPMRMSLALMKLTSTTFIAVALFTGCASTHHPSPNDPKFAPVLPSLSLPEGSKTGSIYQEGFGVKLWEDKRARRVGDILTVTLSENTTSSKSSSTSLKKDNTTNISAPTVFGTTPHMPGSQLIPNSGSALTLENNLVGAREFSGTNGTDQRNSLSGNITVTIAAVYPNGVLLVRGEKWLTLTEGEEYIRISGLVRPQDIERDNTVLSTKMADARITYSGTGELADANKMGWLSRFFVSPSWLY
jgi:flagellar L-ring protein precursor FlgH